MNENKYEKSVIRVYIYVCVLRFRGDSNKLCLFYATKKGNKCFGLGFFFENISTSAYFNPLGAGRIEYLNEVILMDTILTFE